MTTQKRCLHLFLWTDCELEDLNKNFKIVIEYDGTNFHGWQIQPNRPTIQGEIEKALKIMTTRHVDVHGSGRTDAGVHALAQVATFSCDTKIPAFAFKKGLNSLLPDGIAIHLCREVEEDFHARFSATGKTYEYNILNRQLRPVLGRQYVWHIWQKLDLDKMRKAAKYLIGEHDFKSFEAAGSPRVHTRRIVTDCNVLSHNGENIKIEISANGFLRYMVRNITGTLVQVGLGKFEPVDIKKILDEKKRAAAGMTAPAKGLFLKEVFYQ